MPIVKLEPKNREIEDKLAVIMDVIRAAVKGRICQISGFPESDVLVGLLICPYRDADPAASDVVLYADTCPNKDLEAKADILCSEVAQVLIDLGLFVTVADVVEVWPRFLPGPWCLVQNGEIVDNVSHTREEEK